MNSVLIGNFVRLRCIMIFFPLVGVTCKLQVVLVEHKAVTNVCQ